MSPQSPLVKLIAVWAGKTFHNMIFLLLSRWADLPESIRHIKAGRSHMKKFSRCPRKKEKVRKYVLSYIIARF